MLITRRYILKMRIKVIKISLSLGFDKVVGFVLYDSDQFFQSQSFKPSLNTKRRVLSANLSEGHDMELQFAVTQLVSNLLYEFISNKFQSYQFCCTVGVSFLFSFWKRSLKYLNKYFS